MQRHKVVEPPTLPTCIGVPLDRRVLDKYISALINLFFKILPLWEERERTLGTYMRSLQREILGCEALITVVEYDAMLLSLLSILQYLIDHPKCKVATVKREVFRAIAICNNMRHKHSADVERSERGGAI